jgi:integrase
MRKPKGHIRKRPFGYEIAVPEGRDPITKRYRYRYAYADTIEEAETERQRLVAEVTSGRKPRTQATFGQLLDEVIKVTDLDLQTTYTYEGYIERTIRPALGTIPVHDLEERPELIDRLYAELRRCGKLCGGRRGLIDHRPAGRGDSTPVHECDPRCRPHRCRPAEPGAIAQVYAIITAVFGYAVAWKWITDNPARFATAPKVTAGHADPPSSDEALRLLAAAGEHSRVMAVMTWLALVTGARRGELCALRWPDLSQDEGELLIGDEQPQATAAGTHRERRLTLDPGTADLLADYRENCRHEALAAGGALDEDGFVFSADGFGKTPWHPTPSVTGSARSPRQPEWRPRCAGCGTTTPPRCSARAALAPAAWSPVSSLAEAGRPDGLRVDGSPSSGGCCTHRPGRRRGRGPCPGGPGGPLVSPGGLAQFRAA